MYLPMQETQVRSLIQEDSTCCGTTKPGPQNHQACALEPESHNHWCPPGLESALRQEKSSQWEAHAPQLEKSLWSNKDPAQPKINKISLKKWVYIFFKKQYVRCQKDLRFKYEVFVLKELENNLLNKLTEHLSSASLHGYYSIVEKTNIK